MNLINWDTPKRVRSVEKQKELDGGEHPMYIPNMSNADLATWKGKVVNKTKPHAHVELRKTYKGTQILMIVAEDGYNYKYHKVGGNQNGHNDTSGFAGIRVSANGPFEMPFHEIFEWATVIGEARSHLEALKKGLKC
jgi:hypothetical protein